MKRGGKELSSGREMKSEVGAERGRFIMIMNILTRRKNSKNSERIWSKVHPCAKVHLHVLLLIRNVVV